MGDFTPDRTVQPSYAVMSDGYATTLWLVPGDHAKLGLAMVTHYQGDATPVQVVHTEFSHGSIRYLRDKLNMWLGLPVVVQCHNCPHPVHAQGDGHNSACSQCDCMAGLPQPDITFKRGGIRFPVDDDGSLAQFRAMLDKAFDAVEPGALADYQAGVGYEDELAPHNAMCAVRDNDPGPCDCEVSVALSRCQDFEDTANPRRVPGTRLTGFFGGTVVTEGFITMSELADDEHPDMHDVPTKACIVVPMSDDEVPCTNCGKYGHPRHMCMGPSQPLPSGPADTYRAAVDRAAKDH